MELHCFIAGNSGKDGQGASYSPEIMEHLLEPLRRLHSLGDLEDHFKADSCASIYIEPPSGVDVLRDILTTIKKGDQSFGYKDWKRQSQLPSSCKRQPGLLLPPVQHPWGYQKYPLNHTALKYRFFCRKKLAGTLLQLQPYKNAYRWSW